jgi:hypothetical protein
MEAGRDDDRAGAPPDPARRHRRSAAKPADLLLPADPCDPASRLARALEYRRRPGGDCQLVATLVNGKSPEGLHNFLATYVRYQTHVYAYVLLIADPFPGFGGKPGYPIDLEIDPPQSQNRWTVGFRVILAIPAFIVSGILGYLNRALGIFSWVLAVLMGRVPEGLRNFAAFCVRYEQQTAGYCLVADRAVPELQRRRQRIDSARLSRWLLVSWVANAVTLGSPDWC